MSPKRSSDGPGPPAPDRSDVTLVIRQEPRVDFDETAALAAQGFGVPQERFTPARLRWLYQSAFSHGTTVLSVYAQERKVGQVALVHQSLCVDGRLENAIALVDLFILEGFRSRQVMADLYGAVERLCQDTSVRFILAVPNPKGAKVNVRYLKLAGFLKLDIRVGFCRPWRTGRTTISSSLDRLGEARAVDLFSRFLPSETAGVFWTPTGLWQRLQNPEESYAAHTTEDLLLISSPRTSRGIRHTLFCAFLARPGAAAQKRDVRSLCRAACALHRQPLFVYAGVNRDIPLPGLALPARLRPSEMMVQIRDFQPAGSPPSLSRFELLDFDFA